MNNNAITQNWAKFDPRDYLQEYYADVGPENFALLRFAVKAFHAIPSNGVLLDFGAGPTVYSLIAAASRVEEIHFCDYLDVNLDEVRQWLQDEPSAFNWREFVKATLELESTGHHDTQAILQRETLIRKRVTQVFKCDANNFPPINEAQVYDTIITNFCAEAAADNWVQWRKCLHNIVSLLKPNGFLLLSAVKGATCYSVGERLFPVVSIRETDLTQALTEEDFNAQSIVIESIPADRPSRHYEGLIMVLAQKQGDK
jgi:nicotinamide N-methyltransferase